MLAVILLIIGAVSRFVVHAPNFTPVIAIALFGGVYLKKKYALILPVLLMVLTDLIIGLHDTVIFTWGSIALIVVLGVYLRSRKSIGTICTFSIGSAVLFFIVTNFGVWLMMDLYPKSFAGLAECFVMAIPFFRNTLIATLGYTAVFFGIYELTALRIRNTRLAHALL